MKCGYCRDKLNQFVEKLGQDGHADKSKGKSSSTLALVVLYFKELDQLKSFLRSLDGNINLLIGENTSTLVADRKDRSVA